MKEVNETLQDKDWVLLFQTTVFHKEPVNKTKSSLHSVCSVGKGMTVFTLHFLLPLHPIQFWILTAELRSQNLTT